MGAVFRKDKRLSRPDAEFRLQLSTTGRIFVKHHFSKLRRSADEKKFPCRNPHQNAPHYKSRRRFPRIRILTLKCRNQHRGDSVAQCLIVNKDLFLIVLPSGLACSH
jgi:hypothetical protein